MLNILKVLNPSKAAGIDKLCGKFPTDGADSLSIELNSFPRTCKIVKDKPLFRLQNWPSDI